MSVRKVFIATLLGCTMLSGCDKSDNKSLQPPQTTFSESDLNDLRAQITQLQQADSTKNATIASLQTTISENQQKQDAAGQKGSEDLEAVKSANATRFQELTTKMAGDLAELAKQLAALQTDGAKASDLKSLQQIVDAVKGDRSTTATLASLSTSLGALTTQLAALQAGSATTASSLATLQGTLGTLQTSLAQLTQQVAGTAPASAIDTLNTRITDLQNAILELQGIRVDRPLTQYVNLFVGTQITETGGGHSGNVNPGAQTPFGMVSFGPDTSGSGAGWGYGSGGYYYTDKSIQFFSLTHLNGPGCRGQGAVAMLPADSVTQSLYSGAGYAHSNESAAPGFYRVKFNNGIITELTATTRTGRARFSYADAAKAFLIMDMRRNNSKKDPSKKGGGVDSNFVDIQIGTDKKTISGNAVASPFCEGTWSQPVYFYATFDKPLKSSSTAADDVATLQFDLADTDKTVEFKIGISSVSAANAKLNLETEIANASFADTSAKASADWNKRLNVIQLDLAKPGAIEKLPADKQSTATDNLKKFYTALYRVYSGPTVFSDVNGEYRSMKQADITAPAGSLPVRPTENVANYKFKIDGKDATYKTHYSGFSVWDMYRSSQLVALMAPDEVSEMMQSLVADAQQCGAFPHWVDGSEDTIPMQGDHALNVIAGSYAFGARKFDIDKARSYVLQSTSNPDSRCNDKLSVGRNSDLKALPGWLQYKYIATDSPARWNASSATIEMITSDRSAGAFLSKLPATAAGDQTSIVQLFDRATYWKNIFDASPNQMKLRAKNMAGEWMTGSFHETTEPNYLWAFPQDWTAVIDKLGGRAAAITRLNTLFSLNSTNPLDITKEPTGSQLNGGESSSNYYIGNEQAFATPWAYNWAGAPKYGQYIIPVIMRKNFSLNSGGLPGNDDMGATSAWYVFAALGLYPVIPSEGGFALSTPQFDGITLWLGNGKKLRIETGGQQAIINDVRYIADMNLNNAAYQGSWLPLSKISNGGTLTYTLSATPTEWGAGDALTPPSGPAADYSRPTAQPIAAPTTTGLQIVQ